LFTINAYWSSVDFCLLNKRGGEETHHHLPSFRYYGIDGYFTQMPDP